MTKAKHDWPEISSWRICWRRCKCWEEGRVPGTRMLLTDRWQKPLQRGEWWVVIATLYIYTNSSLPSSGRDSYLLKMERRSWTRSQLSPLLLERDIVVDVFCPDNHSGWWIITFTDHWMSSWSLCPETDRDWLSPVSRPSPVSQLATLALRSYLLRS